VSKGYPTREVDLAPPPETGLAPELCIVCKRRPAATKSGTCATCDAALGGAAGPAS
jgi:hypothetical protein